MEENCDMKDKIGEARKEVIKTKTQYKKACGKLIDLREKNGNRHVELSGMGFGSNEVHIIDPTNKDRRYSITYCGISFCCSTLTPRDSTCKVCSEADRKRERSKTCTT